MSGISGPGGANLRAAGLSGVDANSGGSGAAPETEASASAGAGPRTRPRSMDAQGIGLASSLHASFDAASTPAPMTTPPATLADLEARVKSLPRGQEDTFYLGQFKKMLEGRVTTDETDKILGGLEALPPDAWLATIEKLKATPSDERGLSLLDKLVKYGVDDRNRFIARFADMANKKLGLGLPTVEDRAAAHVADGMRHHRADRVARREVRKESDVVLEYFKSKDKQGFVNGLRAAGEGVAVGAEAVVLGPFVLLGILIMKGHEI